MRKHEIGIGNDHALNGLTRRTPQSRTDHARSASPAIMWDKPSRWIARRKSIPTQESRCSRPNKYSVFGYVPIVRAKQ
jgi:hypothetical protein